MAIAPQFCRVTASTDLGLSRSETTHTRSGFFRCGRPTISTIRCASPAGDSSTASVASSAAKSQFDPKVFRHNLTRSKNYNRKGFGHKEATLELMNREYTSEQPPFLAALKNS